MRRGGYCKPSEIPLFPWRGCQSRRSYQRKSITGALGRLIGQLLGCYFSPSVLTLVASCTCIPTTIGIPLPSFPLFLYHLPTFTTNHTDDVVNTRFHGEYQFRGSLNVMIKKKEKQFYEKFPCPTNFFTAEGYSNWITTSTVKKSIRSSRRRGKKSLHRGCSFSRGEAC